jgi:hypothetical protein
MELYLQFGHGMMEHCKVLVEKWGGGTVVLSPRDLKVDQLSTLSTELLEINGNTLLDPQMYDPRGDHHGLVKHDYWIDSFSTGMLLGGPTLKQLFKDLKDLNDLSNTDKYIIPGLYCSNVEADWIAVQESLITESVTSFDDKSRLATICLSSDVLRSEEQIELLLSQSEEWNVDGYYVVAEHPNNEYLVEDPMWLSNLLNLCAGLKLQNRIVISGYSTHQMLSLAASNIDAVTSGTFLNVRCFTKDKFSEPEESEKRKAKWYYCPHSLSEYKLPFLDLGYRARILDQLKASPAMDSDYADILFSGAQPSLTAFSEREAFRHYLQCFHVQVQNARRGSFRETIDTHNVLLSTAELNIRNYHRAGVRGQHRDYENITDVNRAAISTLESTRGFVLDRQW